MATSVGTVVVNVTPGDGMVEEIRNIVREEVKAIVQRAIAIEYVRSGYANLNPLDAIHDASYEAIQGRECWPPITHREENTTP
jgi:hypothetical protein